MSDAGREDGAHGGDSEPKRQDSCTKRKRKRSQNGLVSGLRAELGRMQLLLAEQEKQTEWARVQLTAAKDELSKRDRAEESFDAQKELKCMGSVATPVTPQARGVPMTSATASVDSVVVKQERELTSAGPKVTVSRVDDAVVAVQYTEKKASVQWRAGQGWIAFCVGGSKHFELSELSFHAADNVLFDTHSGWHMKLQPGSTSPPCGGILPDLSALASTAGCRHYLPNVYCSRNPREVRVDVDNGRLGLVYSESRQVVTRVEGRADFAGVREGEQLLQINGEDFGHDPEAVFLRHLSGAQAVALTLRGPDVEVDGRAVWPGGQRLCCCKGGPGELFGIEYRRNVVTAVQPRSAAEYAGLRPGVRLTRIGIHAVPQRPSTAEVAGLLKELPRYFSLATADPPVVQPPPPPPDSCCSCM